MFTVKCDGKWLYNPSLGYQLRSPKLVLADNSAGTFDFIIEKSHPLYDEIHEITSRITVYRDNKWLWEGRPFKESDNWQGSRTINCEGALAYLNDTIQEQAEYHPENYNVTTWLTALINKHNAKVDSGRQFKLGTVTVEETLYRYTNYETTLEAINEKLITRLGGHMRARRGSDGYLYLDYLKDYPYASTQKIEFGRNLLDYSRNYDLADIATAIIPLGERLEESEIEALEAYTTVESAAADSMHTKNSLYVQNNTAVQNFGWICKVVHWEDVSEPSNLLTKAEKYLTDFQYNEMSLQIKAIDFHLVDSEIEALNLLDEVQVISVPHNLDKLFPISKMEIPLNDAANTTLTLGTLEYADTSLTSKNNAANTALLKKIEEIVPESTILKEAKEQVSDLIKNGALGGYVIIKENEIIITNNLNYTARTAHVWRWNQNGLAYSSTGYNGNFGSAAITANGQIVADFVTAGTMYADRIRGGVLKLGGKGTSANGQITVYDAQDSLIGSLSKDGFIITRGTIKGPNIVLGGSSDANGYASVVDSSSVERAKLSKDGLVLFPGTDYEIRYPSSERTKVRTSPTASEDRPVLMVAQQKGNTNYNLANFLLTDASLIFSGNNVSYNVPPAPILELGRSGIWYLFTPTGSGWSKGWRSQFYVSEGVGFNYFTPADVTGIGFHAEVGGSSSSAKAGGGIYLLSSQYPRTSYNGIQINSDRYTSSGTDRLTRTTVEGNLHVTGNITCSGTYNNSSSKSRLVTTESFGDRLLYCYEMPSPMFGDVGEGELDGDGACCVSIDPVFLETIALGVKYQVFLQAYGDGRCYVAERTNGYFIVKGTPKMKFGWEIKAKQKDLDQVRLTKTKPNDGYNQGE